MKIYRTGSELIVAACDSNLIGKCFEEGDLRLEVSSFYNGVEVERKELIRLLRQATIANLVGEEVVMTAIEEGCVDKDHVIMISGIPHAQMVLI